MPTADRGLLPAPRPLICAVACLLLALIGRSLMAAEAARLTYGGLGVDGQTALTTLTEMTATTFELDTACLVEGLGSARLAFSLVDASPASRRQALAHALGCWWALSAHGRIVLTRSPLLPQGPLLVTTCTSTLVHVPGYEELIHRLLVPWLGGDAGLSLLPDTGIWTASLDAAGQSQLTEIISLLEHGSAQCASSLGDPDCPDLLRVLTTPCHATSWTGLVDGLATAMSCSVSIDAMTTAGPFPGGGVSIGLCHVGEVTDLLQDAGLTARFINGVLCISRTGLPMPVPREHPGQRRRIALLPIAHLAASRIDGELIVTTLRRVTGREEDWWAQPGAELDYLEPVHAVLVAADLPTQMEVLRALGCLDRLGLAEGVHHLEVHAP